MTEVIGGHWGLEVTREPGGRIVKRVTADGLIPGGKRVFTNKASIAREARALKVMSGSGFAPELLEQHDDYIVETDVGDQGGYDDETVLRRSATRMLWEIRQRNLRHGDLKGSNVIIRDNRVWAIDWHGSHMLDEPAISAVGTDSQQLFRTIAAAKSVVGGADASRTARRWGILLKALAVGPDYSNKRPLPLKGKTFLDLGCFQGNFCGMAAAEGMEAVGIDVGKFRSGEDSITIAKKVWAGMPCTFHRMDILDWDDFHYDVVIMFSTWCYIVRQYKRAKAVDLIRRITEQCGVFFFETQLWGDGKGPDFLQCDDDVRQLLEQFGDVRQLVTLPTGRPMPRSVWEVRRS